MSSRYDTWIRIDNIYEINHFDYIREDAECQGFKEEFETEEWVLTKFENDFPEFMRKITSDDIYVEYYGFEAYDSDEEDAGYAVYIHFNEYAMEAVKQVFAEYFI